MMKALRTLLAIALFVPLFASAHELQHAMEEMADQLQVLSDGLIKNKPVDDRTLLQASDGLLKATVQAAKILPETYNGPGGQALPLKDAEIAKYKDMMTKLIASLTEVDQNLKAGKKAEAREILINKIAPLKKEGHLFFKKPEH